MTGSYFNSAFTTVADALKTGRCTLVTDAMVHTVLMDSATRRARGVQYIDRHARTMHEIRGRVVILCAQMFETLRILFNSRTPRDPEGLGNSSGLLGKNLMVHFTDAGAEAGFPAFGATPSLNGPARPNGMFGVRFRNVPGEKPSGTFLRGYGYQGRSFGGFRMGAPGFGEAYKRAIRDSVTTIRLQGFGECLPHDDNYCDPDPEVVDAYGIPALRIHMSFHDNDLAMLQDMADAAAEMLEAAGGRDVAPYVNPRWAAHEVGCARMGTDPKRSVLTPFQQLHDVANVFVMDGSGFVSGGWSNPTLTLMALAVRSCDHLLDSLRRAEL
jgi:choline dehydrogenase-like flavoprotein